MRAQVSTVNKRKMEIRMERLGEKGEEKEARKKMLPTVKEGKIKIKEARLGEIEKQRKAKKRSLVNCETLKDKTGEIGQGGDTVKGERLERKRKWRWRLGMLAVKD